MYECIEDYEDNQWFYFFLMLVHGADICTDKDYIEKKYHSNDKGISGVKVDSNGQKQEGV